MRREVLPSVPMEALQRSAVSEVRPKSRDAWGAIKQGTPNLPRGTLRHAAGGEWKIVNKIFYRDPKPGS